MESYKFIAWADTHWDKLASKCISLEDTDQVERAVFKRAREGNFDFTVFAGDRYLRREPQDEVKVRADRVIEDHVNISLNPHFHLIGNHDWVDNTRKWHTSESLKRFPSVIVMDESKTHAYKNIRIHALPADFTFEKSDYEIDNTCFNLFVFHDAVSGTFLNEARTITYDGGLFIGSIDQPEFDLVLAGDIHIRQNIPFKNTQGSYLGSVIQRTRADAHAQRGWTEYTVSRETDKDPWTIVKVFVPLRNYFSKETFHVDAKTEVTDLILHRNILVDQLVEVKLTGGRADVDRLADDPYWDHIAKNNSVRYLDVLRGYEAQISDQTVDMSESSSILQDLELYLDAGFSSLGTLSRDNIFSKVNKMSGGV
jgi:DNA repair exonuclease SbcCD nuclease subunit